MAAANFSDSAGVTDRDGHGTHVASVVAGTGARAAGARQGVAFGASLLNGKVLDDFGFGSESGIIAGMEWAAAQRARVANMSLGGWPTDGTDPLSQAVDRLTASKRVLFVVSAGNFGPREQTVETPGRGHQRPHRRRGRRRRRAGRLLRPRPPLRRPRHEARHHRPRGRHRRRPGRRDLLGEPVDQWYTRLSGTSMAAPHVAGAAAVLAQRWPDWSPTRLKAVLMATADPNPDLGVYEQGGGRLDVAHAIAQRVIARRVNLDFGFHRYPQTGARPVAKPVLVANLGDQPATVDLTVELRDPEGDPAPAGMAVVSPRQVTLAPGAEATAYVTVDPRRGPLGAFSGALVATPAQRAGQPHPAGAVQGAGALRPDHQHRGPRRPARHLRQRRRAQRRRRHPVRRLPVPGGRAAHRPGAARQLQRRRQRLPVRRGQLRPGGRRAGRRPAGRGPGGDHGGRWTPAGPGRSRRGRGRRHQTRLPGAGLRAQGRARAVPPGVRHGLRRRVRPGLRRADGAGHLGRFEPKPAGG